MCDISQIIPYFEVAAAGVTAAILSLGIAIVLNYGFCTAPGSPFAMIAAGVSSLLAVAALAMASSAVSSYYACMNSPTACAGELSNVMSALNALIAVLSIQATACFVAAGIAWIPWVGTAPMYAILASLILQLMLIPSLYVYMCALASCTQNVKAVPSVNVIVAVASAVAAVAIGLTVNVRRASKSGRR